MVDLNRKLSITFMWKVNSTGWRPHNNGNKWAVDTCNITAGSQRCRAEWRNPDTKKERVPRQVKLTCDGSNQDSAYHWEVWREGAQNSGLFLQLHEKGGVSMERLWVCTEVCGPCYCIWVSVNRKKAQVGKIRHEHAFGWGDSCLKSWPLAGFLNLPSHS